MTDQSTAGAAAAEQVGAEATRASETKYEHAGDSIRVRAHSPIIYWWPVWLLGGVFWCLQAVGLGGNENATEIMGLTFVATLVFVIFSTTVRLRGANSVIFLLIVAIVGILLVSANLSDAVGAFIARLNISMSDEFYLTMFVSLFSLWLMMFTVFDRVKYWEVVPGQVKQHLVWGAREEVLGASDARCHYKSDDFLRHRILGLLFMGDLEIVSGANRVDIHNVFFAKQKTRKINELIVMRPTT